MLDQLYAKEGITTGKEVRRFKRVVAKAAEWAQPSNRQAHDHLVGVE